MAGVSLNRPTKTGTAHPDSKPRSGKTIEEGGLVVHPVVLGAGQFLFEDALAFDLDLVDAVRFPSGTQALTYRPRRPGARGREITICTVATIRTMRVTTRSLLPTSWKKA